MYGGNEKAAFDAYDEKNDGFFTSMGCCTSFKKDGQIREIDDNTVTLVFDQPKPIDAAANFNYFPGYIPPPTAPARPSTGFKKQKARASNKRSNQWIGSLSRPWTSHHKARPVIGGPTNFRKLTNFDLSESPPQARLRPVPGRRFRPLELSIYMPEGRLSPLPDFSNDHWSYRPDSLSVPVPAMLRDTSILVDDGISSQFDIRRDQLTIEPEVEAYQPQTFEYATPIMQQGQFAGYPGIQPEFQEVPYTPRSPTMYRSVSAAARPQTSASPLRSPDSGSFHSRSFSDLVRPLRSSSIANRPRTDTVDEAIRELNTIVEERRHSAIQKSVKHEEENPLPTNISPVRHIPAIAPSMVVRARSQTLTDIGSAFSTPFSGPGPVRPSTMSGNTTVVGSPLASPSPALTKSSSMSSKSRLRTWFSRSTSTSSRTMPARPITPKQEPVDQIAYQNMTRFSTSSSVTEEPSELFSPMTITSGHSLGYTATTLTTSSTPLVSPTAYERKEVSNTYGFAHPLHSHSVYPQSWLQQDQPVAPLQFQQIMLQQHQQQQQQEQYYSPGASYYTSSSESSPSKMSPKVHRPIGSKRGLSVDTIMSTSSVGTSILGGEAPEKPRDRQVRISGIDTWDEEEIMVGVAY